MFQIYQEHSAIYLDSKAFKWLYLWCTIGFTILFLVVFQPFGISEELHYNSKSYFDFLGLLFGVSIAVFFGLYLSQFILRPLFKMHNKPLKTYLLWFVTEPVILVAVYFIVSLFIPDLGGASQSEEWTFLFQLKNILQTLAILIFPFIITLLVTIYKYQNLKLHKLESAVHEPSVNQDSFSEIIHIKNENDQVELTVDILDVVFLKSDNQYVKVNYLKDEQLETQLIRTRLKSILDAYPNKGLLRAHRSYIVNQHFAERLERRGSKQFLTLQVNQLRVPVSNSYLSDIKAAIL
ncbi:LytTR family transcriptional regulator [Tamlana sp. s12]|uniref:LytTR family DNA-binding domain-containing protein n=1 Tax=Tamlana sp. s12 TaxID=1630406 RepID=UPI0007FBF87B|nr:LytTR family DNA-binding domain-containing protein [Tamlana sp. s12]OBQ51967.1 hypothetical protein VQ01_14630 [Tamlana sp. s12]QQY82963.1 LytTR family transcriptional regulator [Tamlana sp. s12]